MNKMNKTNKTNYFLVLLSIIFPLALTACGGGGGGGATSGIDIGVTDPTFDSGTAIKIFPACRPGKILENGVCVNISAAQTQTCVGECATITAAKTQTCVGDEVLQNGVCRVPQTSCANGLELINGACVPVTSCAVGMVLINRRCTHVVCPPAYQDESGECRAAYIDQELVAARASLDESRYDTRTFFASLDSQRRQQKAAGLRIKTYDSPSEFVSTNPQAQSFALNQNNIATYIAREAPYEYTEETNPEIVLQTPIKTYNFHTHTDPAPAIASDTSDTGSEFVLTEFNRNHLTQANRRPYSYVSFATLSRFAIDREERDYYEDGDPIDISFMQTSLGKTPAAEIPVPYIAYRKNRQVRVVPQVTYEGIARGAFVQPTDLAINSLWQGTFNMQANFHRTDRAEGPIEINGELKDEAGQTIATFANGDRTNSDFSVELNSVDNIGYNLELDLLGSFYGPEYQEISALGQGTYSRDGFADIEGRAILALLGRDVRTYPIDTYFESFAGIPRNNCIHRFLNCQIVEHKNNSGNFILVSTNNEPTTLRVEQNTDSARGFRIRTRYRDINYYFDPSTTTAPLAGEKQTFLNHIDSYPLIPRGQNLIQRDENGHLLLQPREDDVEPIEFINSETLFLGYNHARFSILTLLDYENEHNDNLARNARANGENVNGDDIQYLEIAFINSGENRTAASQRPSAVVDYIGDSLILYSQNDIVTTGDYQQGNFQMQVDFANTTSNNITATFYDSLDFANAVQQGTFTGRVGGNNSINFTGTFQSSTATNPNLEVRGGFYGFEASELSAVGHGQDENNNINGIIGFVGAKAE